MSNNIKKVVLAYSGGLDTSVIVPWLKENYNNPFVIGVCVNVGQTSELSNINKRANSSGLDKLIVIDAQKEFIDNYCFKALKAGAKYEGYTMGTPLARPLIAQKLVEIANKEHADAICHGATGKGNDQVRFELSIMNLAPNIKIIAPWREWELTSRSDEFDYCEKHNIKLNGISREKNYSKDLNLWHLSHEGMELEDPSNEPNWEYMELCNTPEKASDEAEYISIEFEKGLPIKVNDEYLDSLSLVKKLNEIAGKHGIGILDIVANRIIGMKAHSVSESPGATLLYRAHELLESLCLDKSTTHFKNFVAQEYAQLVYTGHWFTPLKEALDVFVDKTQEHVSGVVKLKLYKGNMIVAGLKSKYSLHSQELATFEEDDIFNQKDSSGFLKIYGLEMKTLGLLKNKLTEDIDGKEK
ncbi:MAG: argininosuccinate synthase [Bacilli bacterium]|nr:argininosuccinate synthase [Bacilli bacterium]